MLFLLLFPCSILHLNSSSGSISAGCDSSLQAWNQMVHVFLGTTRLGASSTIDNPVVCLRFTASFSSQPFLFTIWKTLGIWHREHLGAVETKAGHNLITALLTVKCFSAVSRFMEWEVCQRLAIIIVSDSSTNDSFYILGKFAVEPKSLCVYIYIYTNIAEDYSSETNNFLSYCRRVKPSNKSSKTSNKISKDGWLIQTKPQHKQVSF